MWWTWLYYAPIAIVHKETAEVADMETFKSNKKAETLIISWHSNHEPSFKA